MRMIDADALIERMVQIPGNRWNTKTFGEALDSLQTVCGWISVKDRLPEEQGVYLVAFKPPFPKVTIAWWATRECGWYDIEYNFLTDGISHWMPLPPMPEQEVSRDE